MIPGLGKQTITIGTAESCDIRLGGPGVAPEHARIVHQGGGQLVFIDAGAGPSLANGAQLQPNTPVPFDFRTQFVVGQAAVPISHPAIVMMLMHPGGLSPVPGQITFGREAEKAHVVVQHPNVSGHHATVTLNPLTVTDHGSTSGTWLAGRRLTPQQAQPIDANALLTLGPVPLPMHLVFQLAQSLAGGGQAAAAPGPAPAPAQDGGGDPGTAPFERFPPILSLSPDGLFVRSWKHTSVGHGRPCGLRKFSVKRA